MAETVQQYKKRVAKTGGDAKFAKVGRKGMSAMGKKGMANRWHLKKRKSLKKFLFG